MKALIDADILLYEIGSLTDDEGHPLKWQFTLARLDGIIKKIVRQSGADSYEMFVTGKGNFREEVATIKPYKGHRSAPKPHHYQNIKDYLSSTKNHKVTFVDGYEADDAMSIEQYKRPKATIIASRDKDLKMVPGWHYSWPAGKQKEKEPFFVSETEGMRWFFAQLLMGDATDNIPGLFGVGEKYAKDKMKDLDLPYDMYVFVQEQYEKRFGSYWKMFMHENARLLWMLRTPDDDVRDMLNTWEDKRLSNKSEVEF